MVKFLNNLLAQLTPFFFYAIGGYFALRGTLDIGQLVAVIGAYRELPPPLKELIDWDQQRLDVQVKYDQVVQHFSPERLSPSRRRSRSTGDEEPAHRPVRRRGAARRRPPWRPRPRRRRLRRSNCRRAIGVVSDGGAAASVLGAHPRAPDDRLQRQSSGSASTISPVSRRGRRAPPRLCGRRSDPVSRARIRDNLVYGLRHRPLGRTPRRRRGRCAAAHGGAAHRQSDREHRAIAGSTIRACRRQGRGRPRPDPARSPATRRHAGRRLSLRPFRHVRSRAVSGTGRAHRRGAGAPARSLAADGMAGSRRALRSASATTIRRRSPRTCCSACRPRRELMGRSLAENPASARPSTGRASVDDLVDMGSQIAETMTEIFRGLPPGHPLFEQFSFIGADELGDFETSSAARCRTARGLSRADQTTLLSPAARLCRAAPPPRSPRRAAEGAASSRHARRVREMLERRSDPGVEFYDAERVTARRRR